MPKKKGMTLLELIVVIVVVGILAMLATPIYTKTRERALDNEARATLRLVQAAEKVYRMEFGNYFQSNSHSDMNNILKVSLPVNNPNWAYTAEATGEVKAARGAKTMNLPVTQEEPTCTGCD